MRQMEVLRFEPLDVFSIRTARPFDIGGVTHADYVWPPPPWTVMGALRGALAELLGLPAVEYGRPHSEHPRYASVTEVIGPPDGAARFKIGPVLPGVWQEAERQLRLRWPLPADVLSVKDGSQQGSTRLARLRPFRLPPGVHCNQPGGRTHALLPPADLPEHPEKSPTVRHFGTEQIAQWLAGEEITAAYSDRQEDDMDYYPEPRIGIRIDPETHLVSEGLFYLRTALQLARNRSLAVPLVHAGKDIPWAQIDGHLARFGADGHLVRIRKPIHVSLPECPAGKPLHHARLLCVGPTHPHAIAALERRNPPVHVRAVAAGRPVRIGGWKLLAQVRNGSEIPQGPRRLRTYYPPGAVLYVESEGDLRELHCQNLAHDPEEEAAGFGFCLVGLWQQEQ
ncbi:MAG: hypothetical protein KatS3mg077_0570 [Candidatus Binatia bacterium]|nr:MAG: hypothetical protein KatS3mg077_0570 [Candidatus Binatia bacterium]